MGFSQPTRTHLQRPLRVEHLALAPEEGIARQDDALVPALFKWAGEGPAQTVDHRRPARVRRPVEAVAYPLDLGGEGAPAVLGGGAVQHLTPLLEHNNVHAGKSREMVLERFRRGYLWAREPQLLTGSYVLRVKKVKRPFKKGRG